MEPNPTTSPLKRVADGSAAIVAIVAVTVLFGWVIGNEQLQRIIPNAASMTPNTAVGFLGAAAVLWLHGRHRFAAAIALYAVGLLGLATLAEYVFSVDFGIDNLIFDLSTVGAGDLPGRPSAVTAAGFVLFALGALAAQRREHIAETGFSAIALTGLALAFLSLAGYTYGTPLLYKPVPAVSIALHTAGNFLVLFVGLSALRPDLGWIAIIRSTGSGGVLARWLLPTTTLLIPFIGWLLLEGRRAGDYDLPLTIAIFALSNVIILTAITLYAARKVDQFDKSRREAAATLAESEAQLRVSESRYRRLIETVQSGMAVIDGDRIAFANQQFAETLGAEGVNRVIGLQLHDLIDPGHYDGLAGKLRHAADSGLAVIQAESRLRRFDGETFLAAVWATAPYDENGKRLVALTIRDISAEREAAERVAEGQKLAAVGQLTGGVAHDFNNLLTVVLGSLELAANDVTEGKAATLIKAARDAAERGAALTHQLLAFSRRQPLKPEVVDCNVVIQAMQHLLTRTLGEDIRIRLNLEASLWTSHADPSQLESALLNLAINARDAMPDGGILTIESKNTSLDISYTSVNADVQPGEYVVISVTDSGTGMTPDVLDRAVEPFFTTKETGQGSGMGLSMIYGYAKQSGGHFKLYSEVGLGTTARLYLPKSAQSVKATVTSTATPEISTGGETIFVVEDNPQVRELAVTFLEHLGYAVISAGTGADALDLLNKSEAPISLLFTDVVMPGGMNGRGLADAARQQRPNMKVLFTSGYSEDAIVHQGKLDPGVSFLSKPYQMQDVAAAVRAVLDDK